MLKKTLKLFFTLSFLYFLSPQKAHAYLDPGSGSYLVQILIASIAGIGYFLKTNWQAVKSFFSRKQKGINEKKNK